MLKMEPVDHHYERGWRRYGFDNLPFVKDKIHGSDNGIDVYLAFNRGTHRPHISFATVYPSEEASIGMHMHRDFLTGEDSEEWYIVIDGTGEMTFSNGDTELCHAGDLVAIYPGTGHSFRAVDGPCRIISITPDMFTYAQEPAKTDEFPSSFHPRIVVTEVDEEVCAVRAVCKVCGSEWVRPAGDTGAATLPIWAREHRHTGEGTEQ